MTEPTGGRHAAPEPIEPAPPIPYGPTEAPASAVVEVPALPDPDAPVGELFGLPASAGTLRASCRVAINGATVASSYTLVDYGDGNGPVPVLPQQLAVDRATVTWGRSGPLEQPTSGTASLALFDQTGKWATGDLNGDPRRIGQSLTLTYLGAGLTRVYFRGRITACRVRPHVARFYDPSLKRTVKVRGHLVRITGASLLTDVGNRTGTGTWPEEPLSARRSRILALFSDVVPTLTTRATFDGSTCPALDVEGTSALELVGKLYDTCGADRFTYDPNANAITYVRRRDFAGIAGLTQLTSDTVPGRVYPRTIGLIPVGESTAQPPWGLDAGLMGFDGDLYTDQASRITRVELDYIDTVPATDTRATIRLGVPGEDETANGRRALRVDTFHGLQSWAQQTAGDFVDLARREAAGWRLDGPLTFDTKRAGGFRTVTDVDQLLSCFERPSAVFLFGSWLSAAAIRPVFGLIGGTVVHDQGEWVVEALPAPVSTVPTYQPRLQNRHVVAAGYSPKLSDVDRSLTWADLQFISYGYGQSQSFPEVIQ